MESKLIEFALAQHDHFTPRLSRPFTATIIEGRLVFTPLSGKPRVCDKQSLETVCRAFQTTKSFRRRDYERSWHASYILGLIKSYLAIEKQPA